MCWHGQNGPDIVDSVEVEVHGQNRQDIVDRAVVVVVVHSVKAVPNRTAITEQSCLPAANCDLITPSTVLPSTDMVEAEQPYSSLHSAECNSAAASILTTVILCMFCLLPGICASCVTLLLIKLVA